MHWQLAGPSDVQHHTYLINLAECLKFHHKFLNDYCDRIPYRNWAEAIGTVSIAECHRPVDY